MKSQDVKPLPPLVKEYISYISSMNKSELTALNYALDLRIFFRFILLERGLVSSDTEFDSIDVSVVDLSLINTVTLTDAYSFLNYCRYERSNDARARARKVVSIRRFYRYLVAHTYIDTNPLQELELPRMKKTLPIFGSMLKIDY